MTKEQASVWAAALNFGGQETPTQLKNSTFRAPDDFVRHLRYLAHQGKRDTDRLAREEAGKVQIIYGDPVTSELETAQQRKKARKKANTAEKKAETAQSRPPQPPPEVTMTEAEARRKKKAEKRRKRRERHKEIIQECRQITLPPATSPPSFLEINQSTSAPAEEPILHHKGTYLYSLLGTIYNTINSQKNPTEASQPSAPETVPKSSLPRTSLPWAHPEQS